MACDCKIVKQLDGISYLNFFNCLDFSFSSFPCCNAIFSIQWYTFLGQLVVLRPSEIFLVTRLVRSKNFGAQTHSLAHTTSEEYLTFKKYTGNGMVCISETLA